MQVTAEVRVHREREDTREVVLVVLLVGVWVRGMLTVMGRQVDHIILPPGSKSVLCYRVPSPRRQTDTVALVLVILIVMIETIITTILPVICTMEGILIQECVITTIILWVIWAVKWVKVVHRTNINIKENCIRIIRMVGRISG